MSGRLDRVGRFYALFAGCLSYGQDALLLAVRLYWGWGFFVAGKGKLLHLDAAAESFQGWGIPAPYLNAVLAGLAECIGGLLLLAGLASRLAALVLVGVMGVAYGTAHYAEAVQIFSNPDAFVAAAPFLYLLASLLVLVFGPGWCSIDALLARNLERRRAAADAAAEQATKRTARRDLGKMLASVIAGLAAGVLLAQLRRAPPPAAAGNPPEPEQPQGAAAAPAGGTDENLLLADEHICRGLNTCRDKGQSGKNACAGQGTCALVKAHGCQGLNDCKGHGGCDNQPGQNQCKGQGACAVPLKDDTWKKARAKFEQLMARQGKAVGTAPAKS